MANKSVSNPHYLTRLGPNVCRRLERACLTAVSCPVRARAFKSLVEPGTDATGRRYPAIRPERPAQQTLLATLASLACRTAWGGTSTGPSSSAGVNALPAPPPSIA